MASECCDFFLVWDSFLFSVLGFEPKASHLVGKHCATKLHPSKVVFSGVDSIDCFATWHFMSCLAQLCPLTLTVESMDKKQGHCCPML